ncbi:MAG: hypothetical protein K2G30_09715 [Muribaculaceae bacterium]|nr:hypothetical protein [Muribaculaceae bacterium]
MDIMESEERRERREGRRDEKGRRGNRTSVWLLFGVGILILLLLVWLTIADFWGDTDVAAMINLF